MTEVASPVRQRVTHIVLKQLAQRPRAVSPGPDDDLRKVGLSSLDMVKVVLALEDEFQLAIPEPAITPTNFRSIATIEALVASLGR